MRQRFELVVGVDFENNVADDEETLDNEMTEVREAIAKTIEAHVTKNLRGSVRVWIMRANMPETGGR